jgi:hypothetical protein
MKYRKKPAVVDAVQWTGQNCREMYDFLTNTTLKNMTAEGKYFYIDHSKVEGGLVIKTLEGEHIASISDYIIKGVKGEFYPCKKVIFEETYEIVDPSDYEMPLVIIPVEEALRAMKRGEVLYVNEDHDEVRWNVEKSVFEIRFHDGGKTEDWWITESLENIKDYATYHRIPE